MNLANQEMRVMEERFGFLFGCLMRSAVLGCCLAALCFCNTSCILSQPVGGSATIEAYQWTGRDALIPGAFQSLSDQAKTLSAQPSREGVLTEPSRIITIPFFAQEKMPDKEELPPKRVYELFDPVVLAGSEKRFDFPKRSFVRIFVNPMYAIPMDPPPAPGALVFAEGSWPVLVHADSSSAASHLAEQPSEPKFVLRTVHHPQARSFDFAVGEDAGVGGYNCHLLAILDKHADRLFGLIDKSPALTPQDRLTIYQQLTRLAEGAMELDDSAEYPTYRDVLKKVLPILRAKSR